MKIRKLTKKEKDMIFNCNKIKKDDYGYSQINEFVTKYYPPNVADKIMFCMHSEYNDNNYDTNMVYIAVYDKNNKEVLPLEEYQIEARVAAREIENFLPISFISSSNCSSYRGETDRKCPSFIMYLNEDPELFMVEDE
jgi:hypothetical protein